MSNNLDVDIRVAGGDTQDATGVGQPTTGAPTTEVVATPVDDREVEVWVCDVNGKKYPVTMPISSRLVEVMHSVRERYGYFQGIDVGFKGGRNEFTTISELLPAERPDNFDEVQHLRKNPIKPKFKRECLIL